jgi:hypothetical protein
MNIVKNKGYQTWITDLQMLALDAPSGNVILNQCLEIAEMLINKNVSYGNSALNPVRIFSKADPKEQLMVRLDDKLSRIKNSGSFPGDNDIDDMTGYLVLYKIANSN